MAGKNANAPVGAPVADEAVEKVVVSSAVKDAIAVASESLQGGELLGDGKLESAATAVGNSDRGNFFDPTLSQYKEGLCIYFDPENSRAREVPVGKTGNTAIVVTLPAGMRQADGTIEYTRPFNAYISTFRKQIQLTDEVGEPILDERMNPQVVDGAGNAVWDEMRACHNDAELLSALSGRAFRCATIRRGYGPSNFVTLSDGSRKPQGHKLTSLPLFEEI